MYHLYILKSDKRKNWSYVGITSDIDRRFAEHTRGTVKSTKGYRPLSVVYSEEYPTEEAARKRELYLKSGIGREEKQQILEHSGIV